MAGKQTVQIEQGAYVAIERGPLYTTLMIRNGDRSASILLSDGEAKQVARLVTSGKGK